jgi:hypothetical protein
MRNATQNVVSNGPSLPAAEDSFEVSVVMDDEDSVYQRELASTQYTDADVVDVEVVNHSPFLAGY